MSDARMDTAADDDRAEEAHEEALPAPPGKSLGERALGGWTHACNALQYLAPLLLAPFGGLVGLTYYDLQGALAGALLGMLLAVLVMPLLRRLLYLGVAVPLALVGQLRKRPVLTGLLLLAALLAVAELRRSLG